MDLYWFDGGKELEPEELEPYAQGQQIQQENSKRKEKSPQLLFTILQKRQPEERVAHTLCRSDHKDSLNDLLISANETEDAKKFISLRLEDLTKQVDELAQRLQNRKDPIE